LFLERLLLGRGEIPASTPYAPLPMPMPNSLGPRSDTLRVRANGMRLRRLQRAEEEPNKAPLRQRVTHHPLA